jgi:ribonuclease III
MSLQYPRRQQALAQLLTRLDVPSQDEIRWDLLDRALTHATADPQSNYEQLEFVGDAVVKLAAAEFLLEAFPELSVGEFTALRSVLVSDRVLGEIADSYGFDRYLAVAASAQFDQAGRGSRMADAFEAVLAALYLSRNNLSLIRSWLDRHFQELAVKTLADPARQNYKAALQQFTQAHLKLLPEYRNQELTQMHNDPERFESSVWIQAECLGQARGRSIKAAQQAAAQQAYNRLTEASSTAPVLGTTIDGAEDS